MSTNILHRFNKVDYKINLEIDIMRDRDDLGLVDEVFYLE